MRAALRLLALPLLLAVPACGDSTSNNNTSSDLGAAASPDLGSAPDLADDHYVPAGYTLTPFLSEQPEHTFDAAQMVLEKGKDYMAVIETDAGRMVMDLFEVDTPVTVNSFVFLARHHYFDGIVFHRVINGFMAQTGDPTTIDGDPSQWGAGGPGYLFELETRPNHTFDAAGVVGMARTKQPNTNGSQFFITFQARPDLDPNPPTSLGYTVFAKLTEGLNVLPKIKRGEPPATPTVMTRVYIIEK